MPLPIVVIVGRPNVGKSSLLNMLARERISIVDSRPGITRDRVSTFLEYGDRYFELVDTGGIGIVDDDHLEEHVEQQIQFAIERADVILFLVDVQDGRMPLDDHVAARLRKLKKPIVLVANKSDDPRHEASAGELVKLGFGEAVCVSALHGRGRDALLSTALGRLPPGDEDAPELPTMELAIVGKRNAGKSTLVNALAGEPRVIVSEIPGTTRDAIDVRFQKDGKEYIAIDTAGVRKKSSMSDIDFYSYTRALSSIRRADVVLLLIDASLPVSEVDLKLAQAVMEEYKPVVIGVNKWDLARGMATAEDYDEYFQKALRNLKYAPIVLLTAKEGRNVDAAVDLALALHRQARTRITTAKLNEAMRSIVAEREPMPRYGVKRIKIYYATQAAVAPPSFVFFCNNSDLVTVNYRRFMENRLREILPFPEVPMRLMFRASVGRTAEERIAAAALDNAEQDAAPRRERGAGPKPDRADKAAKPVKSGDPRRTKPAPAAAKKTARPTAGGAKPRAAAKPGKTRPAVKTVRKPPARKGSRG